MSEKHPTAGEVLAHIAEQEGRLVVTRFTHEDAWRRPFLGLLAPAGHRPQGHPRIRAR